MGERAWQINWACCFKGLRSMWPLWRGWFFLRGCFCWWCWWLMLVVRLNNLVTSLVYRRRTAPSHSDPHCLLRQSESYQCSSLIWQMPLTNVLWGGQQQREDLENITKNKSPILDRHLFLFHFFPSQPQLSFYGRIFCTGIETHGVIMSQLNHDLGNLDVSREVKMWS